MVVGSWWIIGGGAQDNGEACVGAMSRGNAIITMLLCTTPHFSLPHPCPHYKVKDV